MRFMSGLESVVAALNDLPKLKILVEALGFGHLHLYVTVPRVVIFLDAILDLFAVEVGEDFNLAEREGWKKYVGGVIIFVKAHCADRINILLQSWKSANEASTANEGFIGSGLQDSDTHKERVSVESGARVKILVSSAE